MRRHPASNLCEEGRSKEDVSVGLMVFHCVIKTQTKLVFGIFTVVPYLSQIEDSLQSNLLILRNSYRT